MAFTALHRALGAPSSPLSIDMIRDAIAQGVEEQNDLDWKKAIPVPAAHDEFAKDVAAMANSGGGLLVYGVAEDPGATSAANKVVPVTGWGDREERRLRGVAYSKIQPPVHGLNFDVLADGDDVVIALTVPPSPMTPHLVWMQDRFAAPVRYGAQTHYMNEAEIERAYRQRFTSAGTVESTLAQVLDQALPIPAAGKKVWMVVIAVPLQPRPGYLERLDHQGFTDILIEATNRTPFLSDGMPGRGNFSISPRRGLRRWRHVDVDHSERTPLAITEVHDDGTVVYAEAMQGSIEMAEPNHLHPMDVQVPVVRGFWTLRKAATKLAMDTEYAVRVTLRTNLPDPLFMRSVDQRHRGLVDADPAAAIHDFMPIDVTVDPMASDPELLVVLREVLTDVVNQGGISDPGTTYVRETLPD